MTASWTHRDHYRRDWPMLPPPNPADEGGDGGGGEGAEAGIQPVPDMHRVLLATLQGRRVSQQNVQKCSRAAGVWWHCLRSRRGPLACPNGVSKQDVQTGGV